MVKDMGLPQLKFLVVEDERDLHEILKAILKPFAAKVDAVSSLEEARMHMKGGRADVMVCDYNLSTQEGQKTGLDLWAEWHERFPDKPFIMISGHSSELFGSLLESGMDLPHYISKPLKVTQCREEIEKILHIDVKV